VPTFSLANGNVPESLGPAVLPAAVALGWCTGDDAVADGERTAAAGRLSAVLTAACACFCGTGGGGGTPDVERRGESPIDAVLDGLEVLNVVVSTRGSGVLLSEPKDNDAPVRTGARSVCEPPMLFNAVLDTALAELGRAQLPTDAAEVLPSTCGSAFDRRLDDGLEGSRQRSDIR